MQHEGVAGVALEGLDQLGVVRGAEGAGHQGLGLAAGEEGGTVSTRQNTDFAGDLADLVEGASVEALAVGEDRLAGDRLDHRMEDVLDPGGLLVSFLRCQFGERLFAHRVRRVLLLELAANVEGLAQFTGPAAADGLGKICRPRVGRGLERGFGDVELGHELALKGDDLLDLAVGEIKGIEDDRFRQFVGTALHHRQRIVGCGDREVEITQFLLFVRGEDHQFAVDPSDANTGDRLLEGDLGRHQEGQRGARDAVDVRAEFVVGRNHPGDDLGFAVVTIGEQRSETAVDQPAGEDLPFGRPSFAFEEAAGDAAAGVGVFAVVNCQGQEVDPLALAFLGARGDENHGVAHSDDGRSVRLFGDFSGLELQGLAVNLDGLRYNAHSVFQSSGARHQTLCSAA